MIQVDREFMAWLRKRHQSADVANFLHISLLGAGWYLQSDLALEIGCHWKHIGAILNKLRRVELIDFVGRGNSGTFVWWIRQGINDRPDPCRDFPRWVVRYRPPKGKSSLVEIRVGEQSDWAARRGIAPGTLRNFLNGHSKTLLGRYELISTPFTSVWHNLSIEGQ